MDRRAAFHIAAMSAGAFSFGLKATEAAPDTVASGKCGFVRIDDAAQQLLVGQLGELRQQVEAKEVELRQMRQEIQALEQADQDDAKVVKLKKLKDEFQSVRTESTQKAFSEEAKAYQDAIQSLREAATLVGKRDGYAVVVFTAKNGEIENGKLVPGRIREFFGRHTIGVFDQSMSDDLTEDILVEARTLRKGHRE